MFMNLGSGIHSVYNVPLWYALVPVQTRLGPALSEQGPYSWSSRTDVSRMSKGAATFKQRWTTQPPVVGKLLHSLHLNVVSFIFYLPVSCFTICRLDIRNIIAMQIWGHLCFLKGLCFGAINKLVLIINARHVLPS
jgi:hypothetical protein